MAGLRHADSRRLYSWWWDSHISPKNSKWLQDNLSDMDMKIKAMIKLIEEDADSFARRAEMYYKKRPELMRLVEEFYRAYRALAERYDHATGALRQAHRTIAEAFPNQVPAFSDDWSPASSATDSEYTFGDSTNDLNGSSPHFIGGKRNDIYSDDGDSLADRKGLKQTSGMFTSQDEVFFSNISEKKNKKSLDFSDDGVDQLRSLQEKILQLSSENESLKLDLNQGSEKSSNLENQVKQLQEAHTKLDSEKKEAILQFQDCLRRVVELEAELEVFRKVNAELLDKVERLNSNEETCHLLERENQYLTLKVNMLIKETNSLQEDHLHKNEEIEKFKCLLYNEHFRTAEAESAVETLKQLQIQSQEELTSSKLEAQNHYQTLKEVEARNKTLGEDISQLREENHSLHIELKQKREEMNVLNVALQNECKRSIEIEALLQALENLHGQSQKELKLLILDVQSRVSDLKDLEMIKQLVEELSKIKDDIQNLNERNTSLMVMINSLQAKILCLIDVQGQLKNQVELQLQEKSVLQRDISNIKGEMDSLRLRQTTIADQMEALGLNENSFQSSVQTLQNENLLLKETCKRHEAENLLLFERIAHMDKISEKNTALAISLSDTNVELQGLREKMVMLQHAHSSLQDANASLVHEKNSLILKVENIEGHVDKLAKKNTLLECSLSDANAELEGLRGQLKNMEEAYRVVYNDKCSLDVERNTLLTQVENMGLCLENLKKRYEVLLDEQLILEKEKEITRRQLIALQDSFRQEKEDHEDFKHCTNARLAILENQISKINESNLCMEGQLRNEQHKLFNLEVEQFVLQRCMSDLISGNLSLQSKCQELEQDNKGHMERNMFLTSVNGRLVMEMQMILKALTKERCNSTNREESHLQDILDNINELQNSVLVVKNENLGLQYKCQELEQDNKGHKDKNMMLSSVNGRLVTDMQMILKALTKQSCNFTHREESQLQDILDNISELQTSALAVKNENLDLQHRCQQLEQDNKGHEEKNVMLSSVNGRLVSEMQMILKALTKESCNFTPGAESYLQDILDSISELQDSVLAARNENLGLQNKCQVLEQDNNDQKENNVMLSSVNGRLIMEMQMILKAFRKESCNITCGEESRLQDILDNISDLQKSLLDTKHENLGLIIERSINDVFYREIACSAAELESNNRALEQMYKLRTDELQSLQAERYNLLQSNNHLEQNLGVSYQREKTLKERVEVLERELLASKEAEFQLRDDNSRLIKEISLLSSQLCELGKDKDNLEEEIKVVLKENVALDCLSVMLKQFNDDTSLKFEALLNDLRCTRDSESHLIGKVEELNETIQEIEAENSQLKSVLIKLEEFRRHMIVLAVESSITKYINNELTSQIYQMNHQIESTEKLLTQKEEALLEVCMILQKLQKVEEKLLHNLTDTKLELDVAKHVKDSLEKKIITLSDEIISKDSDLAQSCEANASLALELAKLQKENEELETNGSNLQRDIRCCEGEVTALLNDLQIAAVCASVYKDKLLHYKDDREIITANNMVQSSNTSDVIAMRDAHIEKLNNEVYHVREQNRAMKVELDDYLPVIRSLQRSLYCLESCIISSHKDGNMKEHKLDSSCQQHPIDIGDKFLNGVLELEKLQKKVESIQEALGHYGVQYVAHSIDHTGKTLDDQTMTFKEKLIKSDDCATVNMVQQVDKIEESEGLQDTQICGNENDLIMKDIQLDHASSPTKSEKSTSSYRNIGSNPMQTDDQMLELWKTDEWESSSNSVKPTEGSWIYTRHDGEVGKNEHPSSELAIEKELGVDKLTMPNRGKENRQDWNKVLERLSSDAQRLTALETGLLELKNKVERSVQMYPKNNEYDDIRGQLQEAEDNILQLLDMNKKLIEKAETSSNNFMESDLMNQRWRQISGRARRGSEKIGRLELELQKLQYIFLKLEELDNQKTRAADRRSRVLLRDYLYGSSQSRKKNLLCCFKPKTKAG